MSIIQPSVLPIYSSGINSASSLLSNQLGLQPNQDTTNTNDLFGDSYSLSLSDAALNMFGGDSNSDSSDSDANILSALTYSNFSTNSQSDTGLGALFSGLNGIGSGSAPIVPTSTSGPSFAEAELADGGPLPAFLLYVDKAMNLSSAQQQSLQNIANENMNIPGDTPAVVQQIATELQQAGIPETI